jgi:adenylate cyclase
MNSADLLGGLHADPLYLTALASLGGPLTSFQKPPQKGSIAVLPFSNLSGDAEQEYFVDGLTEDIITDLSNEPGLFVIARNTSLSYKGRATDVRRIAYDLGVQNILEGSVRKSAQRLRINVQLSNAVEGRQLWAERFDRDVADIFELQDEVTKKIVSSISGKLGQQLNNKQKPDNLEAYDKFLRGRYVWAASRAECERGQEMMEEVLRLEPDYAAAHAELGIVRTCNWLIWSGAEQPNRSVGDFHSKRAVELAPRDSQVLFRRAWVALTQSNYAESQAHFETALEVNSNDADSWLVSGDYHFLTGNMASAVDACANGLRLNPQPPSWYYLIIGGALVGAQKYEEAVSVMGKTIEQNASSRRFLAVALAKLGRIEEAHHEAKLFVQLAPQWSSHGHTTKRAFKFQKDRDWWREAYLEAGLPA